MSIIIARAGKVTVRLDESSPADEAYLQQFIADNPNSLPLDRIKENARLLVVCREFPTSSGPIDVLAVDQDGDLYVVETKLYKNPDKRRVVAQVLDYGAALWKDYGDPGTFIEDIDGVMRDATELPFRDHLKTAFELSDDQTAYVVERMKRNLRDGTISFLVLMDRLHEDLRNLILFLNAKSRFDILAVEMEFYRHEGTEIIIPRLFGAEVKKEVARDTDTKYAWDQRRFLDVARKRLPAEQAKALEALIEVLLTLGTIEWKSADFQGIEGKANFIPTNARMKTLFSFYTWGQIEFKPEAKDSSKGRSQQRQQFAAFLEKYIKQSADDDAGKVVLKADQWMQHLTGIEATLRQISAQA